LRKTPGAAACSAQQVGTWRPGGVWNGHGGAVEYGMTSAAGIFVVLVVFVVVV
jgi:hypothetical protein